MFSGSLGRHTSIGFLGTHQKFNRTAFRLMKHVVRWPYNDARSNAKLAKFPSIRDIQSFEGSKGPDGLKYNKQTKSEPPHFYNPKSKDNKAFFEILSEHYANLVTALKKKDMEKAAFEASWLAHTITDGLTPAHHFPYEQEIQNARGKSREQTTSTSSKLITKGDGLRDTLRRNWQIIGRKGTLTTHTNFEAGVGVAMLMIKLPPQRISGIELAFARTEGAEELFKVMAESISDLNMYERFYKHGWTFSLIRDVRFFLAPTTAKTISLIWLIALEESMA